MATPVPPPPAPPAPPAPAPEAVVPPPLPSPDEQTVLSTLDLARTLGLVFALLAGLLFLLLLVLGIVRAVFGGGFGGFVGAGYCLVSAVVNFLIAREMPALRPLVGGRQYAVARDRLLVWTILGFLFFVVEGIVLLVAWLKLDSISHAPILGAPNATATAPCPRCGGPLAWVPEYQRYYCGRCSAYA